MKKLLVCLFLYPNLVWALTPQEIVKSSLKHFPKVIESLQQLEEETNNLKSSRGQFDGKLSGKVNARTEGFYDGDAYEVKLEKPIPYFNSRIFGGKRQSYDQFPSYEGKSETLSEGEDFVGFSVSLLRNSLIDQNRYNIRYIEQNKEQAKINVESVKLNVQTMALKAYWTWYTKGHELKVFRSILELAEKRDRQLRKRIKAGDLARIYATENNQYIVKRRAQVSQKNMEFLEASFYLSLFYRNNDGAPITPERTQLPDHSIKKLESILDTQRVFQTALNASLDLQNLSSKEKQARLDMQIGLNDMLPELDVKYEWSQDRGNGSTTLEQEESRVMLNLEVPLEYRKGLGKRRAGKAKLAQVQTKQQWVREKIRVESNSLVTKLNSFAEIFDLTLNQVDLAEKLSVAERRKFRSGASDLILVNIREENLAEAQIKNLATLLKYHYINADIRNLLVEIIAK